MHAFQLAGLVLSLPMVSVSVAAECDIEERYNVFATEIEHQGGGFGEASAISGGIAIVGEPGEGGLATETGGAAYLFDATTGELLFPPLLPDDGGSVNDEFGFRVGISGELAIVGAPYADEDGAEDAGAAYTFDVSTGMQLHRLVKPGGGESEHFGYSVAISGNYAIVGAKDDNDLGADAGKAYIFDMTTGGLHLPLFASDTDGNDRFGTSVAVSGNFAVVGAPEEEERGSRAGAAYVFEVTTGDLMCKLTADDAGVNDRFGISVGISGQTVIVGALNNAAYLCNLTTGEQIKLVGDAGWYGQAVGVGSGVAMVGAQRDDEVETDAGAAYLYSASSGDLIAKLTASNGTRNDSFGRSVAVHAGRAIVGAYADSALGFSSGSAYIFDVDCPIAQFYVSELPTGEGDSSTPSAADKNAGSYSVAGSTRIAGTWRGTLWTSGQEAPLLQTLLPDDGFGSDGFVVINDEMSGGQIVGGSMNDAQELPQPRVWSVEDTVVTPDVLPAIPGGDGSGEVRGLAADAAGEAVGWSQDAEGVVRAVHWSNDGKGAWASTVLPDLGSGAIGMVEGPEAGGMIADGDVEPGTVTGATPRGWAGAVFDGGGRRPALWTRATPEGPFSLTLLPTLAGGEGTVLAAADAPTLEGSASMTGWLTDGKGRRRAVCFSFDGTAWTVTDLGAPDGFDESAGHTIAQAPDGALYVAGTAGTGEATVAALWAIEARTVRAQTVNLLEPGFTLVDATSVVVDTSGVITIAAETDDGRAIVLATSPPPPSGPPLLNTNQLPEGDAVASRPRSAADAGVERVITGEVLVDDVWHAAVWTQGGSAWALTQLADDGFGSAGFSEDLPPSGLVVGGMVNDALGFPYPQLWTQNGEKITRETLPGLPGGDGTGEVRGTKVTVDNMVNAVGWSHDAGGVKRAAQWEKNGKGEWSVAMLEDLGFGAEATGLLDNDSLVTLLIGAVLDSGGERRPAVWERATSKDPFALVLLPALAGGEGSVLGAGASQLAGGVPTLAGWSTDAKDDRRAVRWTVDDGEWAIKEIDAPEGFVAAAALSIATAPGTTYVAGHADNGPDTQEAALWLGNATSVEPYRLADLVDLSGVAVLEAAAVTVSPEGAPLIAAQVVDASADAFGEPIPHAIVIVLTPPLSACPADLDESGDVGFPDLLSLLAAWGECPGCPQDLDGSGDAGFADLLTVLSAWGPCP